VRPASSEASLNKMRTRPVARKWKKTVTRSQMCRGCERRKALVLLALVPSKRLRHLVRITLDRRLLPKEEQTNFESRSSKLFSSCANFSCLNPSLPSHLLSPPLIQAQNISNVFCTPSSCTSYSISSQPASILVNFFRFSFDFLISSRTCTNVQRSAFESSQTFQYGRSSCCSYRTTAFDRTLGRTRRMSTFALFLLRQRRRRR